jgi:hypothetical protein
MTSVFASGSLGAAAFLGLALALVVPACSSSTVNTPAGTDACDDTKCAPGNKCLSMDGEVKCRKTCSSNTDPATNCPVGATCAAGNAPSTIVEGCTKGDAAKTESLCGALITEGGSKLTAYTCGEVPPKGCLATATPSEWCCNDAPAELFPEPFCVKQLNVVPAGPKRFGAACNGSGGLDNPDCDSASGFYCYGTGPGDGASFCTRYDCHSDRECAPNYYCATINVAPNVTTSKPTVHKTTTACLRRDYCAPCKADLDCPPVNNLPQHCVPDDNYVGFCAPECATAANCAKDAKCVDGGIGIKTCYPRAGQCVGDGSLCSPCRSDADCGDDGACVTGQYTTERSCAKKSEITCKTGSVAGTDFKCPPSAKAKATIRCRGDVFEQVPMNYCHGLYAFGESADIGCWTPPAP